MHSNEGDEQKSDEKSLKEKLKDMKNAEYTLYKYKLIGTMIIVPIIYIIFYFLININI